MKAAAARWVARWWRGGGGAAGAVLDSMLWPGEQAFRAASGVRNSGYERGWLASERAPIPVVSIGNLTVGGTGKTPVAAWVAAWLRAEGRRPGVVMRGYGADEIAVHRELNADVPVFADPRRAHGVATAAGAGCDVVVLDDGFQHRALQRDLDIVLIAAESWSPAPRLLPRGPWREPLAALGRADLLAITRKVATPEAAEAIGREVAPWLAAEQIVRIALLPGALRPVQPARHPPRPLASLAGERVVALTSLADPAPFHAHLIAAGVVPEIHAYPDHHAFTDRELARLLRSVDGRPLVMTLKEAVKVSGRLPGGVEAYLLEQRVVVEAGLPLLEARLRSAAGVAAG